jgi:hypothetical protein
VGSQLVEYAIDARLVEVNVVMCCNEHVIHVDHQPSQKDFFGKDCIHHHLESCWGVGQPKKHYRWFEKALVHHEGHFPFISCFDTDVVVPPSNIELGEQGVVSYLVDELWD